MLRRTHSRSSLSPFAATSFSEPEFNVPTRFARTAMAFVCVYLALEWLTHFHAFEGIGVTLWNPSPALGIALLVTRGFRFAPLLFVAALLASFVVYGGTLSLTGKLLSSAALALGYVGLSYLLWRKRADDSHQGTLTGILRVLLFVPMGALAIAIVHCGVLVLTRDLPAAQFAVATTHFWIGDTVGIITLLPALMSVLAQRWSTAKGFDRSFVMEGTAFAGALAVALWLIFGIPGTDDHQFFYLLFLPVTWIAVRHGLSGAAFAVLVTHVALVVATEVVHYPTSGFMAFQLLMLALAAMTLLLGALVTDRRQWHEEVKAQQAQLGRMTRFSAGGAMGLAVAHQISQPLSTLGSYLHIALRQVESSGSSTEIGGSLKSAVSELERAREVLERLRDFVSHGKIETAPVDLAGLANSLAEVMRVDAKARGVSFSLELGCVPDVLADATQIEQVILNLVGNAVDAAADRLSMDGAVTVRTVADGSNARIEIEDNGPGIAPEIAERLFEPFASNKSDGLGLGLALARQIIDAHGGKIWWEPVQPAGTRFVVQLGLAEEGKR